MSDVEPSEVKKTLSAKSTEELIQIWTTNNRDEYTTTAFEIVQEVLTERKVAIPKQNPYQYHPEGKYRKIRILPLHKKAYGAYRGPGSLLLEDSGIRIRGKHVLSTRARWGIVIGLTIVPAVLTGGALIIGVIPIYLLVEHVFLKKEELTVPWDKISAFAVDPERNCVGIAFDGPPLTSPIMYVSDEWKDVALTLRQRIPGKDCTPQLAF